MLVALRKESVDRNLINRFKLVVRLHVALRKESVDRNAKQQGVENYEIVALRKESVDRNLYVACFSLIMLPSLSARRAWIEI